MRLTSASPLSRMLSAMRVKSPFSQSAWFGFGLMAAPLSRPVHVRTDGFTRPVAPSYAWSTAAVPVPSAKTTPLTTSGVPGDERSCETQPVSSETAPLAPQAQGKAAASAVPADAKHVPLAAQGDAQAARSYVEPVVPGAGLPMALDAGDAAVKAD